MRPYIICHMFSSVDGRIDCTMTEQIDSTDAYYDALDQLQCDSILEGRETLRLHTAAPEPFVPSSPDPIGHEAVYRVPGTSHYLVGVDTRGSLTWNGPTCDGSPLLIITSEDCPRAYHDRLTAQGISWIATGRGAIDLPRAMDLLSEHFSIHRLALTGGGHINAAFLAEDLIDEVSLMVGAGIDGRAGQTAVFDGIADPTRPATLLTLTSVEQMGNTVWMRYTMG